MSSKRQLVKAIKILSKRFSKFSNKYLTIINKPINWLLRTLFITQRRRESTNAGFVLPTVAMVALVVVLLTTAILFRSFDRSKNASNVRVNEAVLNAAAPAIDRARAKLDALFEDPTLPRGTPSDSALYDAIKKDKYRLGDETRLKLAYDFNGNTGIQSSTANLENDETLKTAWKFAVDTDNNGKKDTYTLYGIYFRSPTRNTTTGQFNRKRNPLEARTPPMDNANTNTNCPSASGFSSLVGNSSWYKLQSGNLGKSFFVYTVNVPITNTGGNTDYEIYKGDKGFAALEFQQDRSRVPIAYNAVWSEHDLEITPGAALAVNGRLHTNGNLLIGGGGPGDIELRQVSSKSSCFYNQENGQITVGGNVGTGSIAQNTDQKAAKVHFYKGFGNAPLKNTADIEIKSTSRSTDSAGGGSIGFNDDAYNQRIARMKTDAIALCSSCNTATTGSAVKSAVAASGYPDDIKKNVDERVQSSDDDSTARKILADEIELYLKNRTRRVPFAEVPFGGDALTNYSAITSSSFEPPAIWREPLDSTNKLNNLASGTDIKVTPSQLEATEPTKRNQEGVQTKLGDRIFVGNNLPALWKLGDKYVGMDGQQRIFNNSSAVNWTRPPGSRQRWRNTQIQSLGDLGISARNGFWEKNAAKIPENDLDNVGGVRIVTGAGIYVDGPVNNPSGPYYGRDTNSFLTLPTAAPGFTPAATDILVWPDTMPMSSPNLTQTLKGDLLMRATAVYHYKNNAGDDQTPIACVSSYHDPSYKYLFSDGNNNGVRDAGDVEYNSAKNRGTLPNVTELNDSSIQQGRSNNGVVYNFPGRSTFATYKAHLARQANLVFPNGRRVNQPLKDALDKIGTGTTVPTGDTSNLELADYSAIDTALCAIYILNNETSFVTPTNQPPHGAIKEASFLDAREIKQANFATATDPTDYLLDLEQRQPLEVRVTDINLAQLITTAITGTVGGTSTEYLLPMSGIIYATREDALIDKSNTTAQSELLSPTDFRLDPTRRPNGIRLYNGDTLARNNSNTFTAREKGLILATDLPAYIKGRFNLHRTDTSTSTEIEEFQTLESTSFYDRSDPQTKFACRPGRTGCPTDGGDFWRSATVVADSMTLLSSTFVDGARNQGDFDLNNNTGIPLTSNLNLTSLPTNINNPRLKNGFLENNYLTSADWWQPVNGVGNTIVPKTVLGSYTINGVTPIQRRANGFPLYVMEICREELISNCTTTTNWKWAVGFDVNGDGDLEDTVSFDANGDGTVDPNDTEKVVKANKLGQAIRAARVSNPDTNSDNILTSSELSWTDNTGFTGSVAKSIRQRLGAGDTGSSALVVGDRRYPRRVAFARNGNNLLESSTGIYKPMGVGCPVDTTGSNFNGNGCNTTDATATNRYGISGGNISALWFRTTSTGATPGINPTYRNDQSLFYLPPIDGSDSDANPDLDGQPILVPVLQIHDANSRPNDTLRQDSAIQTQFRDNWLKKADTGTTIFNVTFVVGNSPSRPSEVSAGLQNLVRFLESWEGRTTRIRGGFIQLKRSSYATAPISPLLKSRGVLGTDTTTTLGNLSIYDYPFDNYPIEDGDGLLPFYSAPTRNWGFDVGLLSEQPDLFAQRFTQPSTGRPSEFFREVGRDDVWVKTLLCAGEANNRTGIVTTAGGSVTYSTNAVPNEYRPQSCPSVPNDNG
ncbi:hormogonium polysaccharide biosynthesis protein HpsA [Plectonema radiosum NIES-515]|uniref:Hormogonium polysaccharide biosynthesis protein HpsA n=1 Tax=Plectonema radiosum NIES-515 TaxID=2986073 RepID=A0ABT3B6C7_9CYAN|nr:hormogonium polysaccharide biosynthesis protein HpsA [Plectonema radiosum]MCV3216760.1 hormogonium polysaccharide biosynthesis protein HpsA [Plectonema radiosum NIES-515]